MKDFAASPGLRGRIKPRSWFFRSLIGAVAAWLLATTDVLAQTAPAIASGTNHSLGLKSNGTVWAWGDNTYGQLGDGTTTQRNRPVQVGGLSGVVAISGGYRHSLALKSDGTVWSWGSNSNGQLGDGTTAQRVSPVPVSGLSGVIAIAAGQIHSLAVKSDGTIWAWGNNSYGQLGDGTTTQRTTPVPVGSLSGIVGIAAGYSHSLALKSDHTVWAWGDNSSGQLGDGTTTQRISPVQVGSLSGITAVASNPWGSFSLALKSDGTVWTWGDNSNGELGDGTTTQRNTPAQVSGLGGITVLAAGSRSTLAVKSDGTVWTWGVNSSGQLGDGTTTQRTSPVQVTGLTGATGVAAGNNDGLALKSDGTWRSWGDNSFGQLGDGTTTQHSNAVQVVMPDLAPPTAPTNLQAFAVTMNSFALTWSASTDNVGVTAYYVFRDGVLLGSTTIPSMAVTGVSASTNYSMVVQARDAAGNFSARALLNVLTAATSAPLAAGDADSAVVKSNGTVWGWGDNSFSQLVNVGGNTPASINGLTGVTQVATGFKHTLVVKRDGTVWAWGDNTYGQLGDGTTTTRTAPVQVSNLVGVIAVAAGQYHSLALKSDGSVWAWGSNAYGQLGYSNVGTNQLTPVQGAFSTGNIAIAAGQSYSLVLTSYGYVNACGLNGSGQLGNGTTTNNYYPSNVSGLNSVVAISAGYQHGLALMSDGTLRAWGNNASGQLGDGTTTNRLAPITVPSLSGVVAVAAGASHSVAVKNDGTAWAWGLNASGQLGDGTTTQRLSAVQVSGLTNAVSVAAGGSHTLVLKSDGLVSAWGGNASGQLGDGTTTQRLTAVAVSGMAITDTAAPGAPTNLHASYVTATMMKLTWTAPTDNAGATSYEVFRNGVSVGTTTATWINVLGSFSANYTLTVKAHDGLDNVSPASSPLPVTTTALPTVAAGAAAFSLMVQSDGTVWGWGSNGYGQLGDGTTTQRTAPVQVSGFGGVVAVAAGSSFSLALKSDGTVWAWGYNGYGQLGDGTTTDHMTPMIVNGISGVVAIAVGDSNGLALKSDGTVWAWGFNTFGQLGDGTTTNRSTPVRVSGLSGVSSVAAGSFHSLISKSDGTAWAWGRNSEGQLGDGTTTNHSIPLQVNGLPGVLSAAAGQYASFALATDGTVRSWGQNNFGQLGDGTTTQRNSPVTVSGLSGVVVALAPAGGFAMALMSDGTVRAWGYNAQGQLGNGSTTNSSVPVPVSGLSGVVALAGNGQSLAVKSDGTVWGWARNDYGQLGDGTTTNRSTPVQNLFWDTTPPSVPANLQVTNLKNTSLTLTWSASTDNTGVAGYEVFRNGISAGTTSTPSMNVTGLTGGTSYNLTVRARDGLANWSAQSTAVVATTPTSMAIASNFSLVVKADGTVWGCGAGYGYTPVQVSGLSGIVLVAAGASHSLALKNDGTVWSWGSNNYGQLGNSGSGSVAQVSGLTGVVAIGAGYNHSLAVKSDGTVWTWGLNLYGQLGDGTTNQQNTPVQVSGLTGAVAVAAGYYHSMALKSDGTVWSWGYGGNGQLGDGTNGHNTPAQVSGLAGAIAIAAGYQHSLALKSDGTVWAWGYNRYGQVGDGTTTDRNVPVQLSSPSGVTAVAAGHNFSLALKTDGTVWGWGDSSGQFGDGTYTQRTTPVQASGLTGVIALATGCGNLGSSLAAMSDGTVRAVGDNYYGQLGDGTNTSRTTYVLSKLAFSPDATAPTNPTNLQATFLAGSSFTLTWSASTDSVGVTAYEVFRNGTSLGTTTSQSMGIIGLSSATNYSMTVRARDAAGNWSAASTALAVTTAASFATGDADSAVVKSNGTVWGWGDNSFSQLVNAGGATPASINGLSGVTQVATGFKHTLVVKTDGTVWAWGDNTYGQLGDGTTTARATPVWVSGLSGVIAVAAGQYHSLALKSDGTVWAWGSNAYGQLGNSAVGTNQLTPIQGSFSSATIAIAAGQSYSLVLTSYGYVNACGLNGSGQLGDGTTTSRYYSTNVSGLSGGVVAIAAGYQHGLALMSDGTLRAWGNNASGQLGDGTTTNRLTPVTVSSLSGIVAVAAGASHSVAVKNDGTAWAWGLNASGQLGDGTTTQRLSAVQVSGLTNAVSVAAGGSHTLVLKNDGLVSAWGGNGSGQLGDGTTTQRLTLVAVPGMAPMDTVAPSSPTNLQVSTVTATMLKLIWTAATDNAGATSYELFRNGVSVGTTTATWMNVLGSFTAPYSLTLKAHDGLDNVSPASSPLTVTTAAISTVAAGDSHSLFVKNDGTVWAYGFNNYGQLGDGTTTQRPVAVQVSGLSGAVAVAAGTSHSLILKSDGTVWACGYNGYGQLGDGTTTDHAVPVQVSGLFGIVAIAASYQNNLALKSDGTVWGWGNNSNGQLGDGTSGNSRHVPVQVSGLSGVMSVAMGTVHALAVKSDGTVWAWGNNNQGQLGDGTTTQRTTPVQVSGLSGVSLVAAAAAQSYALMTDGTVRSWGYNNFGQLGDGTTTQHNSPVPMSGLSGVVVALAPAGGFAMALMSDGTVRAWGYNTQGQLGNGSTTNSSVPVPVSGLSGVAALAGNSQSLALKSDGTIWGWGSNGNGQLGDGTTTNRTTPVQNLLSDTTAPSVPTNLQASNVTPTSLTLTWSASTDNIGVTGYEVFRDTTSLGTTTSPTMTVTGLLPGTYGMTVRARDAIGNWSNKSTVLNVTPNATGRIAVGDYHSLAVKSNGTVAAWGYNGFGQLGNGTSGYSPQMTQVQPIGLTGIVAVAAGQYHSLALKNDGTVWAWGYNSAGQLGAGTLAQQVTTPGQTIGLSGIVAVAAGADHSLALKNDGTVWTWGGNSNGQLGDGTTNTRGTVAQVSGLSGIVALAGGASHSVVVKTDGTVWAWGINTSGQLGDGTTTTRLAPTQVSGISGIIAVVTAPNQTLALKNDGTVWAWGANVYGQLGDGTTTQRLTPVQVSGLSGAVAVATNNYCGGALKSDGTVWMWGYNASGNLGDGTTVNPRMSPVQVIGLSGVTGFTTGGSSPFTLAMKGDGTVWGWGDNVYGELGDGTISQRTSPVQANGISLTANTAPTNLQLSNFIGTSLTLMWSAPADIIAPIAGYEVFIDDMSLGTTTALSMDITGLNAAAYGTELVVRARDTSGNWTADAGIQLLFPDTTAPIAPPLLNYADMSATTVTLIWKPSTDNLGVSAYNVYRGGALVGATSALMFVDGGLTANTAYSYTVKAADAAGNLSAASNTLNVTTKPDYTADLNHDGLPDAVASALQLTTGTAATHDPTDATSQTKQNVHRPKQ